MDNNIIMGDIVFDVKPDAVPYNCRISYKVPQICLIMYLCGWNCTCSLVKLQIISHFLKSDNIDDLIAYIDGQGKIPVIRFDSTVNSTLKFAVAYGLVNQEKNGKFKLSENGKNFVSQIVKNKELLVYETNTLKTLSKKLSEEKIKELFDPRRY